MPSRRPGPGLARRSLLTLAAMAPALAAEAASAGVLPPDLARTVADYDRATISNDTVTLGTLVADDYLLVNSDTTIQDKQSYLDDFRVPGFRLEPYVLQEPVHRVWGGVALTGGLVRLAWTLAGERHSRLLRIAHVWTRDGGRWRLAYTQLTRVPEAATP